MLCIVYIIVLQCCRLTNPDQVKKRSKLVLPKPQISDTELEEVCPFTQISCTLYNNM